MKFIPSEFKVDIPESRTAQHPPDERDNSKLLVFQQSSGRIIHLGRFRDIVEFMAGDTIIFNNTKVIPAMVAGQKSGGGKLTILFMQSSTTDLKRAVSDTKDSPEGFVIQSLINPGRRLKPDHRITLPDGCAYELIAKDREGIWTGRLLGVPEERLMEWLDDIGTVPLPPYIKREVVSSDRHRFQTTYAEIIGSLAAPTAGFHFTKLLMQGLETKGSSLHFISLNIGLGTFRLIRSADLSTFKIHAESYYLPPDTAEAINGCISDRAPITLVGTTVMRTLESAVGDAGQVLSGAGNTKLFITPPYDFKVSERLLTNFHRADSTVIQLVAALIGWENLNLCYQTALENDFGFYSYGDAMLVI